MVEIRGALDEATAADYSTWQLSTEGLSRLASAINETGVLAHPDGREQFGPDPGEFQNNATLFYNDCCVIYMNGEAQRADATPEELERRVLFDELMLRLVDHDWLGTDVLSDPAPFIPDGLTVHAEPATTRNPSAVAWPLDGTISERVIESSAFGPSVCVYGSEVEPLFTLVAPWNRTTVDDGTAQWEITIRPHLPGPGTIGDPCEASS